MTDNTFILIVFIYSLICLFGLCGVLYYIIEYFKTERNKSKTFYEGDL